MDQGQPASRKMPCPCKKGFFTVTTLDNGEETWEMLCLKCKQNYILKCRHFSSEPGGITGLIHLKL